MKKLATLCIASLAITSIQAQTYNYLTIKQNNKTISIPLENIDKVTFTVDDLTTPVDNPDYELRILTFEDADYLGDGNYLGQKNWSSLIDSPQYGGPLLYGNMMDGTPYRWFDQNNTLLYAAIDPDDDGKVYWDGGEAVSNYVNPDYATTEIGYTEQLASPDGGHNGSKNFGVHNGYFDGVFYNAPSGGIWFEDGVARVIDHMYVSLTSYALSACVKGTSYAAPASPTDWIKFVAIGTDAQGNKHETEIAMCTDGVCLTDWQRWDLSVLGEIVRLDFNITSSMMNAYGLSIPGYIAYDDIAVRFPKK